jgi:ActR/RegA family two-component response regulator
VLLPRRILILEDEYFLAADCAKEVARRGMAVIGPFGAVGPAMQILANDTPDGAIVDVKVQEVMAFKVIEALRDRGTPLVIYTGYDRTMLPKHLGEIVMVEKPTSPEETVLTLLDCMELVDRAPAVTSPFRRSEGHHLN